MNNQKTWKFSVQVFFSTIVILLCVVQIGFKRDEENVALYWSGLTSVLAYWLPSPTNSKEEEEWLVSNQYRFNQMSSNGLIQQSQASQKAVGLKKTDE